MQPPYLITAHSEGQDGHVTRLRLHISGKVELGPEPRSPGSGHSNIARYSYLKVSNPIQLEVLCKGHIMNSDAVSYRLD